MAQIDTFGFTISLMLEEWADAFALHRDGEHLGWATKNMLYEFERHGGSPPRTTGRPPLNIPRRALLIEYAVMQIARTDPTTAWVLRAYHCSRGRRNYERFWKANALLTRAGLPTIRRAGYQDLAKSGEDRIARILASEAQTA
jgi:hypothetical protein